MKQIRKISSFTLTEMLVVLAVSAIVIGLAYSVLSLFTKNILLINENYRGNNEVQLFELQISLDFQRYHEIHLHSENQELTLKTPLDSLKYQFHDEYIIRNKDTLISARLRLEGYYLGERRDTGIIDALKIQFAHREQEYLFISKENDTWHYIKYGNKN